MAYFKQLSNGGFIYNVNHSVGVDAANARDDVLLVQWMLHRIYTDNKRMRPLPQPPVDGWIGPGIDGWNGPQTMSWIFAYQRDENNRQHVCAVDGRVDSAQKNGKIVGVYYTIMRLNASLRKANSVVFNTPSSDPDMPLELLAALANNSEGFWPMPTFVTSDG